MNQFVKQYQHTHEHVYNYFGEATRRTMRLAAAYTLSNKPFSGMVLQKKMGELNELLTRNIDTYYAFQTNVVNVNVAAQFIVRDELTTDFELFIKRIKWLVDADFPKKVSTVTAALYVEDADHAIRAYALYEAMKTHHPLLTGINDIPISVFITKNKKLNSIATAKLMNDYYKELKKAFIPGEALQLLSQLLVLCSANYNKQIVSDVIHLKAELKKRGIRISRSSYPHIGLLALNAVEMSTLDEVIVLFEELRKLKLLKFNKDIALQIAIQKIILQKSDEMKFKTFENSDSLIELLDIVDSFIQLTQGNGEFFIDLPFGD